MIEKWDITIPELTGDEVRSAYICLPEAYTHDINRRFPVLYMFDGHNVFFDEDATYGQSWGMADYMDKTDTPLIIAAVECNPSATTAWRNTAPSPAKTRTSGGFADAGARRWSGSSAISSR